MAEQQSPAARVGAIGQVVRGDVAQLTGTLTADGDLWERPSACEGWAVADVVSHMAESNDRFLAIIGAALDDGPAPEFTPQQRAERQATVRAAGRQAALDQLTQRVNAVFDRLETAGPEGLARTVTVPAGKLSLAQVATQRLTEVALHGWDVRSAADPRAGLSAGAAPLLLDSVLGSVTRLAGKNVPADANSTYRLELSGEVGGPVTVALAEGKATATRGAPDGAVATLRMPAEAAIRLFWGRLDLERALGDGTVQVEGDAAAARALNGVFRGV